MLPLHDWIGLSLFWVSFLKTNTLRFVCRFAQICHFAFFADLFISSFVLSLTLLFSLQISSSFSFFFFILRQQSALFVFIPPWYLFLFPFFFFCRYFSCSQLWALILFSFDLIWDFLPVSCSLSFVFPLFFLLSCWLPSTYDLIWIFVTFLTATGVVSYDQILQVNIKAITL